MSSREEEYKKIFIAETLQDYDNISKNILELEKNPDDLKPVAEIFRMLHNLKANANAMGYSFISDYAHILENAFSAIREKDITFTENVANILFEGIDHLGVLLKNLDKPIEADKELLEKIEEITKGNINVPTTSKVYTAQNISLSDRVSIEVKKLDDLMNLVGELIIDRDRIMSLAKQNDDKELTAIGSHLYRISNEIQQSVMNTRLVSIGTLFNKFPRIVRDIALSEEKKVNIKIIGQDIKIDRNILQIITDSLLHLVRNAIVHGIETRQQRKSQKKPLVGELTLSATSDKDTVIITVEDDGKGISIDEIRTAALEKKLISKDKAESISDNDIYNLIFEHGFTLKKSINEYSGRGVGLDIVKNALESIGGNIRIHSKLNKGTQFRLTLPTSIAVKASLLFQVNEGYFALPLLQIDSVLAMPKSELHQIGNSYVTNFKGENISLIFLNQFLYADDEAIDQSGPEIPETRQKEILDVIIVSYNNRKIGLIVDKLLRQQEIVIKPLQTPVNRIDLFSGVTLLGTGNVCLLLDVAALSRLHSRLSRKNLESIQ